MKRFIALSLFLSLSLSSSLSLFCMMRGGWIVENDDHYSPVVRGRMDTGQMWGWVRERGREREGERESGGGWGRIEWYPRLVTLYSVAYPFFYEWTFLRLSFYPTSSRTSSKFFGGLKSLKKRSSRQPATRGLVGVKKRETERERAGEVSVAVP